MTGSYPVKKIRPVVQYNLEQLECVVWLLVLSLYIPIRMLKVEDVTFFTLFITLYFIISHSCMGVGRLFLMANTNHFIDINHYRMLCDKMGAVGS